VTLTVVTGDITYGSSYNGRTISGKDFRGIVRVTGANITIKDCIFRGRAVNFNTGLIDTTESTGTITLQNVEVAPSNPLRHNRWDVAQEHQRVSRSCARPR
jgi:hypothetical protein